MNIKELNRLIYEQINYNRLLNPEPTDEYFTLLKSWLSTLSFEGRSPINMKKEQNYLISLKKSIESYELYYKNKREVTIGSIVFGNINAVIKRLTLDDIKNIELKFSSQDKIDELKLSNCTFYNKSIISQKRFIEISNDINNLLSQLEGFHKKSIQNNLKIYFVKKEMSKSAAVYKSNEDIIYIRPDKVTTGDNYGSFKYVIIHELGHRYEHYFKLPTDFDNYNWVTTKYSRSENSFNGEQFAELFALSQWYNKYENLYKDKLDAFLILMNKNK